MGSSRRTYAPWLGCLWAAVVLLAMATCGGFWLLYKALKGDKLPSLSGKLSDTSRVVLDIGYTPDKEPLFTELISRFHASDPRTLQGKRIQIQASSLEADAMVDAAFAGRFDAICPDSSIWLAQLESRWSAQSSSAEGITETGSVGEVVHFAVSPIVIAMWEDIARQMGYPGKSIGWRDILQKARSDKAFRWSHPSANSASGLLATLAIFYAGANKTRGLTPADALAETTLSYVAAVERTVRYYGEAETAIIQRALVEGPKFLDAFVVEERLVVYFNQWTSGPKLVAIYPTEGTLWKDHPLALLERPRLSSEQRQAFAAFRDFILSPEIQGYILGSGYRPADLRLSLDDPLSPLKPIYGVNPREPQTTLQIPGPAVLEVVREAWLYTKRHTNVLLVADVSGSMEGEKLTQAKRAMRTFVDQIQGERERVGLIVFSSQVREAVPLGELGSNRAVLESRIESLSAGGNTALLDAVQRAYIQLQALKDQERINAIVVMTDGRENSSRIRLADLTAQVRTGNQAGVPVVIFCVAYGTDADMRTLEAIAEASGGQARYGDPATIKELYKILSTYF